MKDQIEKLSKEDVSGYEKLVNFTKKIFDKGFLELADCLLYTSPSPRD